MFIPWQAPEKELALQFLSSNEKTLVFHLHVTKTYSFCPSCGTQSTHLHSHYHRFLDDLSIGNQRVLLRLQSRKWYYDAVHCIRRIFTERYRWVKPYARRTERLQALLRTLAFSMSCRQAEKVAHAFVTSISHDTLLRIIRSTSIELPQTTCIGIDDFAFRKKHHYGTLICDLNTHKPLAILPDRTSEIVEDWLKRSSSIQLVSRDGANAFREAIQNANPTIIQVSDRWHLVKNARESLEKWLEQRLPQQIEWATEPVVSSQDEELIEKPIDTSKWALIQQIQKDFQSGLRVAYLARTYQLSRGTIYKYIRQSTPPSKTRRKSKPAQLQLQPFYASIMAYDAQHLTFGQILEKIRAEGYTGSKSAVRRFLEPYRAKKKALLLQTVHQRISRKQLVQFIWMGHHTLTPTQQHIWQQCCHHYPFLTQAENIVQTYRELFRKKDVEAFIRWMNQQLTNQYSPLYRHSVGIRKDLTAVKNAMLYPYSNGLLEGQINRLKYLKRMMYGRAKHDLLEKRMQYQIQDYIEITIKIFYTYTWSLSPKLRKNHFILLFTKVDRAGV